jgi:hypothetical protein
MMRTTFGLVGSADWAAYIDEGKRNVIRASTPTHERM